MITATVKITSSSMRQAKKAIHYACSFHNTPKESLTKGHVSVIWAFETSDKDAAMNELMDCIDTDKLEQHGAEIASISIN